MNLPIRAEHLASAYAVIRHAVIDAGYLHEILWQQSRSVSSLKESTFLREYAWVVLSSGMKEKVIRGLFPRIAAEFHEFHSASVIASDHQACVHRSLQHFRHVGKINAIAETAKRIDSVGFSTIRSSILEFGHSFLRSFKFMGPATSIHLAKNLGWDIAKPDRHLIRLAEATGFTSPMELCHVIGQYLGEKMSVVDLVLWRFAVLCRDYVNHFLTLATSQRFLSNSIKFTA